MPSQVPADLYPNIIVRTAELSGAGAVVCTSFDFGFNILDRIGIALRRVEYHLPTGTWQANSLDQLRFGLCTRDLSSLGADVFPDDGPELIDYNKLEYQLISTANGTAFAWQLSPVTKDWSTLPGGGILVPPRPLYLFINSDAGVAGTPAITSWVYFTVVNLTDAQYLELIQTRQGWAA